MASSSKAAKDEIVQLETDYWEAMKAKDGKRTASLSGTNSLVTGARGVVSIPRSKMGKMTEDGHWTLEDYEFADVHVVQPAENVAIIAYSVRQTVTMDGKRQELKAADSSTWVRDADGWHCHAHSETFLK
ncbi:nuclear transport factor 2 family protein [Roseomonas terrae]|uniref:Nuclear transport factor 2 family protein n=1 Tax=Neoroseomonas terrae TaxID=424799 RepID=A0ABS5ECI6_9PROT|nr:nuclear transport factor 2 family protein [Neoroseomonas terrae]MBR0648742.1 nuclear transport factor 2 family protein [Neoroseomonas terrae]